MENYTKNARGIIRAVVHDAFGDYVQNVQLSTADYREELDKIAGTILEEMAAPDLYEALQRAVRFIEDFGGHRHLSAFPENCEHCHIIKGGKRALSKGGGYNE